MSSYSKPTPSVDAPRPDRRAFDANLEFLDAYRAPLALLARAMLAAVFVHEGADKIIHYRDVVDYMASFGVDGRLLPLVIAAELGSGLLVLIGWKTRWAALALFGFCLLTAALFHAGGDPDALIQLQKNIAIAGGFLLLAAVGPGPWSVDARLKGR